MLSVFVEDAYREFGLVWT